MSNGNADIGYYLPRYIKEQLVELIINARAFRNNSKIALAAGVFGHLLCIHPFADGNGRAARFLLQKVLENLGLWVDVKLPLGHLARIDRKNYIYAMRGLSINGNYERYLEYFSLWLSAASELSLLKENG